jgi:D-glycero-D-manno-heptose 1,7-bisphosphate phosphatase
MILDAQKEFNIDLGESILIGDKESDIEAGKNASIGRTILIGNSNETNASVQYNNLKNCLDEEILFEVV